MHAADCLTNYFRGKPLPCQEGVYLLPFLPVRLAFCIVVLLMKEFPDHRLLILLTTVLPPYLPCLFYGRR